MKRKIGMMLTGAIVLWTSFAGAANQLVVESKTVPVGATGVIIGVSVVNDTPLIGLVVPLKIRQVTTGSFITRLKLSWGGRLGSALTDLHITNQYTSENFNCGLGGLGFHDTVTTIGDSGFAVGSSPAGLMFVCTSFDTTGLGAGADTSPSMKIIVNVSNTPGTFEIDTTCTARSNNLVFIKNTPPDMDLSGITPSFTKGTITIAACNCAHHGDLTGNGVIDILDVLALQNWIYNGSPVPVKDPLCPHVDRGDVNCSGYDDTVDLVYLIDYVFSGGDAPCDPCACNAYPTNCP